MTRNTWAERAIRELNTVPQMNSVEFAQRTGLSRLRAAGLLSKLAMYGRIERVSKYRGSSHPEQRMPAVYRAKGKSDA